MTFADAKSFEGRQVLSLVIGVGLDPDAKPLDPFYDEENDSWLLAEIFYEKAGAGTTDLWPQIGPAGLPNRGQRREETDGVFGALTDPALNGDTAREQDSATPEAHVVPDPPTGMLIVVGFLGLIGFCRRFNGAKVGLFLAPFTTKQPQSSQLVWANVGPNGCRARLC